jgi:hypothetical protein
MGFRSLFCAVILGQFVAGHYYSTSFDFYVRVNEQLKVIFFLYPLYKVVSMAAPFGLC